MMQPQHVGTIRSGAFLHRLTFYMLKFSTGQEKNG